MDILMYVDDLLILASSKEEVIFAGAFFLLISAIGIPMRWGKTRGGTTVKWIGLWLDLSGMALGVSPKRATWLADWLEGQVKTGSTDLRDMAAVLGRMCFAMGPLEYTRPFIAPSSHGFRPRACTAGVSYRGQSATS